MTVSKSPTIKGINDSIFEHLKDKVSVHCPEKYKHCFRAGLSTLLRAESGWFQAMENQGNSCGQDSETLKQGEAALNLYVRMIMDARKLKQASIRFLNPFAALWNQCFHQSSPEPSRIDHGVERSIGGCTIRTSDGGYGATTLQSYPRVVHGASERIARYANNLMESITTESNLPEYKLSEAGGINRRVSQR